MRSLSVMLSSRSPSAISPTGHYTGYTWVHAGLSDPALVTTTGRVFYDSLRLPMAVAGRLGLPTLDGLLVGRHVIIDQILTAAIDTGRISQVIELACGLSPRGLTFTRRYGERLSYIEADLPGMVATKTKLLAAADAINDHHRVVEVDAFALDGPNSLAAIAAPLDREQGLAVISEGLVNYFPIATVTSLWEQVAATMRRFPHGCYLSDIVLQGGNQNPLTALGMGALSLFVRGQVHLHFSGSDAAAYALRRAGFAESTLHRADRHPAGQGLGKDPAARLVHVIEATTGG